MTESVVLRAGQQVRVEHIGVIVADAQGLWICWDGTDRPGPMLVASDGSRAKWAEGATVTVLAEPRPDEPPPGSVVTSRARFVGYNLDNPAESTSFGPHKWMRGPHGGWDECGTFGSPKWEGADWDDLLDPVIDHLGWTP